MFSSRTLQGALCPFAVLYLSAVASAQTGYWIGPSGGNWSDPANWQGGIIPSGAGATAVFDSLPSGSFSISVDRNVSLGSLAINSPLTTLSLTGVGTSQVTLNNGAGDASIIARASGLVLNGRVYLAGRTKLTSPWYIPVQLGSEANLTGSTSLTIDGGEVTLNSASSFSAVVMVNRGSARGALGTGTAVVTNPVGAWLSPAGTNTRTMVLNSAQGMQQVPISYLSIRSGGRGGMVFEKSATLNGIVDLGSEGSTLMCYSDWTGYIGLNGGMSGGSLTWEARRTST